MKLFRIIQNWFKIQVLRFKMRKSKLNKAIKQANKMHRKTNKRYRVFWFGSKYHVWERRDIRDKQASGLLRWDKRAGQDFDGICFYDTNKGEV